MIRRAHRQPVAARAYRSEPDAATPRACPGPQRSSARRRGRWGGLARHTGRPRPTPQTHRLCHDERMAMSILLVDDDDAFRSFTAGDRLEIEVSDDGRGGADPANGSGLTGLIDRVDAAGGSMSVSSPAGAGTRLTVTLPIDQSEIQERP